MTIVNVTTTNNTVEITDGDVVTVVPVITTMSVVVCEGGIPPGGITNDILVKTADTDYNVAWSATPELDALRFDLTADMACQPGQLSWNADEGTLNLCNTADVVTQIGQETLVLVRNNTGAQINNGTAVMFTGSLGNSGRITVAPMVSNGTYPGYVFLGVATDDIPTGEDGYVTTFGKVRGVDTRPWPDGTVLWCNPAVPGGFTSVEPYAPNLKLPVAAVINSATNGILMVRSDTGRRLQDLHDVEANGNKDDGEVLTWNETANRWEPSDRLTSLEQRVAALEALN